MLNTSLFDCIVLRALRYTFSIFGIEKMNDLNYIGERMNRTLIIRLQGEYLTIRLYPLLKKHKNLIKANKKKIARLL